MSVITSVPQFIADNSAVISLLLIVTLLAAFISEKIPASGVAIIGASACLMLGLLPFEEAVSAFSNQAVITIAAMLILSQALVRTGIVEAAATWVLERANSAPMPAVFSIFAGAILLSAFVNSTPIVIILIPLMTVLANAVDISQKRLLIPLSYAAILGGTCTLLGTSTNLLVDGIVRELSLPGFGIFDITPVGLVTATTGIVYLTLIGRHLLPPGEAGDTAEPDQPDILTEIRIVEGFEEIDTPYASLSILLPRGVRLISTFRKGERLDIEDANIVCELRDRLVLRVTQVELATLNETPGLQMGSSMRSNEAPDQIVVRLTVGAGSTEIDKTVKETKFASLAPLTIIGASRHHHQAGPDLANMKLRAGDRLWISATPENLGQAITDPHLVVSNNPLAKPFLRRRAYLVLFAFVCVVLLAAAGVMPIGQLAFIGVGAMLLLKIIDTAEAWEALDLDLILLICGMLIVGITLQKTGAVTMVVDTITPYLRGLHPLLVIIVVYLLCSVFTELVSNSAVAIIMTPLVILLAQKLGLEPRTLILTVMFGASASFATPIGYQTNTLVYRAGNYQFADFLKVGLPMNILVGLSTCTAIYFFAHFV